MDSAVELDLKKMRLYDLFKSDGEESEYYESEEECDEYLFEVDSNGARKDWVDDPDFYAEDKDGYHEMNPKEREEYYQRVYESDGFDVPSFPKAISFGRIQPVGDLFSNIYVHNEVDRCAVYALEQHNKEANKNYTFHKIVKANMRAVAGVIYYITFQAKDLDKADQSQNDDQEAADLAGGPIVEFEAQVFVSLPNKQRVCEMDVMNFRQKGSNVRRAIQDCCGSGSGCGAE